MKIRLPEFRGNRIKEVDPPGVIPGWLIRSANSVAWVFVAILVATVFLRSLDIARSKAVPLEVTNAGTWHGDLAFYFPLFAPLVLAAIALPWTAKIVIPMFCSFDWRNPRHRWPKAWCAVLTGCVAIVTMSSGFPLYHGAFNERFKQEAVKLEQVDMSRAALAAEKQSIDEDLKALAESPNKYQAGAALAGAEAWAKRIATAEADNDPQLGMIKKALSDAERGDQLREARKKAITAVALAPTKAAAMEQVKGGESYGSDAVVGFINAWWGFALFVVIEMCALIAGWLAYMMQMSRTEQLAEYEASQAREEVEGDALAITDQTGSWQPMPQEKTYDENGDELIPVRRKTEVHWRRKAKKKTEQKDDPRAAKEGMFAGVPAENVAGLAGDLQGADDELDTQEKAPSAALEAGAPDAVGLDNPLLAESADDEIGAPRDSAKPVLEDILDAQEDQQADEPVGDDPQVRREDALQPISYEESDTAQPVADEAYSGIDDTAYDGVSVDDQAPLPDGTTDPVWPEVSETDNDFQRRDAEESGGDDYADGAEEDAGFVEPRAYTDEEIAELEAQYAQRRLPAPEAAE